MEHTEYIIKKSPNKNWWLKVKNFIKEIWFYNINLSMSGKTKIGMVLFGVLGWMIWQPQIQNIFKIFNSDIVNVFYMVPSVAKELLPQNLFSLLIILSSVKLIWGVFIGLADFSFYKKITGQTFDYANMINMVFVNSMILFLGVFSYSFFDLTVIISAYKRLLEGIPTLIQFNGAIAFMIAMLIGDFCFYWAHRFVHHIRIFWNLGHIYHHRNENLTQLTHGVEPRFLLLNAEGVGTLFILPFIAKVFAADFSDAGLFIIPFSLINIWIDPSHSVFLYHLENKYKALKILRLFFVTTGVHYTHHSKDPKHNKRTGCNFGARLTIWDRLFGTYVEPSNYLPETGLYSRKTDYCINPIRFLFLPYIRFIDELKSNSIKYWPKILFGSVFWSPPNKSKLSH